MAKVDVIAELLDADHSMNYRTGKFENVGDNVVAEDTYEVVDVGDNEIIDVDEPENEQVEEPIDQDEIEYLEDEELAKENIKQIIADGMELLEDLYENVRVTEQPKSFEYAAVFMKTMVDMNNELLNIHDRKKKRKAIKTTKDSSSTTISQVNNNIHIHESKPTNLLKKLKMKR